jgi:hypothetical protein
VSWDESPWLRRLEPLASGCWPRLLCWVKLRGIRGTCKLPAFETLAEWWKVPTTVVADMIAAGVKDGAIIVHDDSLTITNWFKYQEHDATAAKRQAKFREKTPNHNAVTPVNNGVTGRDLSRATETLTLTEEPTPSVSPPKKKRPWKFCPAEWQPNEKHRALATQLGVPFDRELTAFREWEFKDAKTDADRAFFRWLRTAAERPQTNGNGRSRSLVLEDGRRILRD